jgi:hypothetical protein
VLGVAGVTGTAVGAGRGRLKRGFTVVACAAAALSDIPTEPSAIFERETPSGLGNLKNLILLF